MTDVSVYVTGLGHVDMELSQVTGESVNVTGVGQMS